METTIQMSKKILECTQLNYLMSQSFEFEAYFLLHIL